MKQTSLFLALLCLYLISCKKEENSDNVNDPETPVFIDSSYLDKWYVIDSVDSYEDTSSIYEFTYDNEKRVTSVEILKLNPSLILEHFGIMNYYYNGSDTLPYKSYTLQNTYFAGPLLMDTTTTFYFLDATGKRLRDSTLRTTWDGTSYISRIILTNYTYVSDNVITHSLYHGITYQNGVITDTLDLPTSDTTMVSNGNDLANIFYLGDAGAYITETTITYNTEPNIFSKFNIRNNFQYPNFGQHFGDFPTNTTNNPLHFHQIGYYAFGGTTTVSDLTYTYQYNSNGLVKSVIWPNLNIPSPSTNYVKNLFTYRNL